MVQYLSFILLVAAEEQKGVCIIQDHMVGIFDPDGREYSTALPFQVRQALIGKNYRSFLCIFH